MKTEMRKFREEEHAALLSLIDTAFGFEQGNFLALLPKLYRKEYAPWESNLCVFEDGVPAAAVGAYYDTITVRDEELTVCGIGNVGVHPDFRGRGYMVALMEELLREMDERGADVSVLGGDRFRYGHFGYDPACVNCMYDISAYSLKKHLGYSAADVHEVTSADDPCLAGMEKLYRAGDIAYSRKDGMFFDSLLSWRGRVFCAGDGDNVEAYCTLVNNHDVGELRMRDATPEKLAAFLLGLMETAGIGPISLCAGINDKTLRRCAAALANESYAKDSEQLLVLKWEKLIRACVKAEARKVRFDDMSCVIRIRGARRTETVEIAVRDGEVSVVATDREPDFDFSREEASDIMLKSTSPAREVLPTALQAMFPLKFTVSQADMV